MNAAMVAVKQFLTLELQKNTGVPINTVVISTTVSYLMLGLHEYDRVSFLAFACLISRHHLLVSWYE